MTSPTAIAAWVRRTFAPSRMVEPPGEPPMLVGVTLSAFARLVADYIEARYPAHAPLVALHDEIRRVSGRDRGVFYMHDPSAPDELRWHVWVADRADWPVEIGASDVGATAEEALGRVLARLREAPTC